MLDGLPPEFLKIGVQQKRTTGVDAQRGVKLQSLKKICQKIFENTS